MDGPEAFPCAPADAVATEPADPITMVQRRIECISDHDNYLAELISCGRLAARANAGPPSPEYESRLRVEALMQLKEKQYDGHSEGNR
jgi:hypothetical protein